MLGRDEALGLVRGRIANPNLVKHMLAVEAVMDALAGRLGEDRELWSRTGLLHDLDLDVTEGDAERHGRVAYEVLGAVDVPEELRQAVLAHVGHVPAHSRLQQAIVAATGVTVDLGHDEAREIEATIEGARGAGGVPSGCARGRRPRRAPCRSSVLSPHARRGHRADGTTGTSPSSIWAPSSSSALPIVGIAATKRASVTPPPPPFAPLAAAHLPAAHVAPGQASSYRKGRVLMP